jgi:hypothetical protein
MKNNSRYQISTRTEPANMIPKFKGEAKASWWSSLKENFKVHLINLGQAGYRVTPTEDAQVLEGMRKRNPFNHSGHFAAVAESSASYSMSVSAFNSQLG